MLTVYFMFVCNPTMTTNSLRIVNGRAFTTNFYPKHKTFGYHIPIAIGTVKRRRNPANCKCAVMPSPFFFCRPYDCHFSCLVFVSFTILITENICPLMKIQKKVEITGIIKEGSLVLSLSRPATGII